ncbi:MULTISPECIES: TonB-dependent receptor [Butyricimonas]|uniref:TonB-dependent receptor n=1 Tax=Butyricimonas TaxID=574697 RepID=UPI0035185A0A
MVMKLTFLLMCGFVFSLSASVRAQDQMVTLKVEGMPFTKVISELKRQTQLDFFYSFDEVDVNQAISLNVKNAKVDEVLRQMLGRRFTWEYVDKMVIIKPVAGSDEPEKKSVRLKGFVYDTKKQPIPGVTVKVSGLALGTSTNVDGWFVLDLPMVKGTLEFSFIGFKRETLDFFERMAKDTLRITLKEESQELEETVVVAFGTQKKESVVASITTVDAKTLKSSSSDLTTQFAGKIPGMIAWQTGGLPGALTEEEMNTKFYIRGITSFQTNANIDPLILIDGVESSKLDLSRMAPEDIESFSVLKDASATAMYGARGANGVILITTKKGEEGNVYTSVRYEAIASMPTRKIDVVDPKTYMRMYNQALLTRNPSAMPQYSVERIERTGSPNYPSWVYPANDWYKIMFKDYSVNHHMGLNLRGGSQRMQYYSSLNWNHDEGMLKTDRLNQFDCNIKNNTFVFRTNLNIDLTTGIRLFINTAASYDTYHGPHVDMTDAYYQAFNATPVDFAPTYPGDEAYSWPHIRFGAVNLQSVNPYMSLHEGYVERERYSATIRAEYIHDLSSVLKGLELRGSMSLNKEGFFSNPYTTEPFRYRLSDYDFETGEHELSVVREGKRTLTYNTMSTKRASTQSTQISYEVRGLHTAAWDEHQTSVTAVLALQENKTSAVTSVLDGIPQRNMSFSMRGSYGFRDKYFVEGSFGYNGSERFDAGHRWGFFPAVGAAWVASSEPFLADLTSHWLSFLKFRLSWGEVGNDGVITSPRFAHLPLITTTDIADPRPNERMTSRYVISSYPNSKIQWEIAEQINLGVEMKLFGGILEANADFYQEIRHNILDYRRTVPSSVGLEEYQLANVGNTRSRGIDLAGKIQHAFSNDFWVIFNGTFTYNKAVYLKIEEAVDKPDWQRKKGHEISQRVGYIAEGLFRDQTEIDNSPRQGGKVMPGDIRYRDLNNDGVIDVNDATHIGFPETPRVIYGFSGFINYKNFEFSFAFQGSGKRTFFMDPMQIGPFTDGRAMLKAIYDDHWSESDMKTNPFWPRLSTSAISAHNPQEDWDSGVEERRSTYFMRECSFLRCTSMELAYNVSRRFLERFRIQNVKLYARVNNPFLITNFKVWDVELGSNGFNYPIQRTFSLGLNVSF